MMFDAVWNTFAWTILQPFIIAELIIFVIIKALKRRKSNLNSDHPCVRTHERS